jgi:hypothetical protein
MGVRVDAWFALPGRHRYGALEMLHDLIDEGLARGALAAGPRRQQRCSHGQAA